MFRTQPLSKRRGSTATRRSAGSLGYTSRRSGESYGKAMIGQCNGDPSSPMRFGEIEICSGHDVPESELKE